jgi:signal peptidase
MPAVTRVGQRPRSPTRTARLARTAGRGLISALVVLLILVTLAMVGGALAGFRVVVVTGGSMAPAIGAGDAVLVEPAKPGEVGPRDIAVYRTPDGAWVIHRVLETRVVDGRPYLVTKGDANRTADHDLIPAANVQGTVKWRAPYAGRVLNWAGTPAVRLILVAVLAVIIWHELTVIVRTRQRRRRRQVQAGRHAPSHPEHGSMS